MGCWTLGVMKIPSVAFIGGERLGDLFVICIPLKVSSTSWSLHDPSESKEERLPELPELNRPFPNSLEHIVSYEICYNNLESHNSCLLLSF